ncbi:MAG: DUF2971 domain-containing protein [Akkermansiaceae bacterium]
MSSQETPYYKYRPLYSDRHKKTPHEFTQAIIQSSELYYATPNTFNDPFDCNLKLNAKDTTDAEWVKYIDNMMLKYPDQQVFFLKIKQQKAWNQLDALGERITNKIYGDSSVLCLSKCPDSIPMFSYYGDDHYGIAIELKFNDFNIPCGISCGMSIDSLYKSKIVFHDVEYRSTVPELNYHKIYNSPQLIKSLIFTKFECWKHEEEYRIFRRNIESGTVNFPQQILTRIIFGLRTGKEEIDLVKSWLSSYKHTVILSEIRSSSDDFSLDIIDFEEYKS